MRYGMIQDGLITTHIYRKHGVLTIDNGDIADYSILEKLAIILNSPYGKSGETILIRHNENKLDDESEYICSVTIQTDDIISGIIYGYGNDYISSINDAMKNMKDIQISFNINGLKL